MNLKNDFKKLMRESFRLDSRWLDWYLGAVYRDEDILMDYADDERPLTMASITPYAMTYEGQTLPAAYISCVATAKAERGKGYSARLMRRALKEINEKGFAFAFLIPAADYLYFFYDKFGFATTIYIDEERYTSLHAFERDEELMPAEPTYSILSVLENRQKSVVRHSPEDFSRVMADLRLDGGVAVAVTNADGSRSAMAFVEIGDTATVKYLLSTDPEAAESVLALVRAEVGEKPIVVWSVPQKHSVRRLRSRGMMRVTDVKSVFDALAARHPKLTATVRVADPIIESNNGIFVLKKGLCERMASYNGHIDLDINIDVLTRILQSDQEIGDLMGLPSERPVAAMMLD